MDRAKHIEIDKAVVERGDQGVGQRMRYPRQIVVVTGGIDDDDAIAARQRFDGLLERLAARGLFHCCGIIELAEAEMLRHVEIASHMPRPGAPVLDQAGKASLPGIEIDRGDRLARLDQGNRNMHRNGGLARATLFIANNNHASRHDIALEFQLELIASEFHWA